MSAAFQTAPGSSQFIPRFDRERTAGEQVIIVAGGIPIEMRTGTFVKVPQRYSPPIRPKPASWMNFRTYFVAIGGALGDADFVDITLHGFEALIPFPFVIGWQRFGAANN